MKKIIHIKKSGKNRYQIELDDKTTLKLYDEIILKYNLLFKKELDNDFISKLERENSKEDVYYQTLAFLSKKMRSKKEVLMFLEKEDIGLEEISKILHKLEQNRLLNDDEFARAYIQDRMLLSSDGPSKIKDFLLSNDIDNTTIDNYLAEIAQEQIQEKLEKIILKKIKSNTNKSMYALKKKIMFEVRNLGYEEWLIEQVFSGITLKENDTIVSKEYYKLHRKLSGKYQGDELERQIYYKLRQKGFSDTEIHNIKK